MPRQADELVDAQPVAGLAVAERADSAAAPVDDWFQEQVADAPVVADSQPDDLVVDARWEEYWPVADLALAGSAADDCSVQAELPDAQVHLAAWMADDRCERAAPADDLARDDCSAQAVPVVDDCSQADSVAVDSVPAGYSQAEQAAVDLRASDLPRADSPAGWRVDSWQPLAWLSQVWPEARASPKPQ